jgi:2-hydroxy-3-keto-5-methylthiopentenyl-1-phosphate phosphatase
VPKGPSIDKLIDFAAKKSIHVNMSKGAHAALKIACIKRSLSIQEVFEEIAQMIGAENPEIISVLEDLAMRKRNKIIKKLSENDADSIFDLIEADNPLNRGAS